MSLLSLWLLFPFPIGLEGQSFPQRTVPDPVREWASLPPGTPGDPGLTILSNDPLVELFRNPALGGQPGALHAALTPRAFGDHSRTLQGWTAPVAAMFAGDSWFGGLSARLDHIEDNPNRAFAIPTVLRPEDWSEPATTRSLVAAAGNRLASRISLGASVGRTELEQLTGIRRSYLEALAVKQHGTRASLTLGGALDLGEGRSLDLTLGRSELDMDHRVSRWEHSAPSGSGVPEPEVHTHNGRDRSRVAEARARYRHRLPELGSEFGVVVGIHSRRQIDTPFFDLTNVPRHPGASTFLEVGVGVSGGDGTATFGGEVAYVPGSARTHTLASTSVPGPDGGILESGQAMVQHEFRFDNWRVEGAMDMVQGPLTVGLGLGLRQYRYRLDQVDHLQAMRHRTRESWFEWSARAGVAYHVGAFEVGYAARVVARGLAPCSPHSYRPRCEALPEAFRESDEMVAPSTPESLPDFQMITHGPTVRVALGG